LAPGIVSCLASGGNRGAVGPVGLVAVVVVTDGDGEGDVERLVVAGGVGPSACGSESQLSNVAHASAMTTPRASRRILSPCPPPHLNEVTLKVPSRA
jgi:hypothetical protein